MLPILATFVVERDGVVKARFVDQDFRRRMAVEELIIALKARTDDTISKTSSLTQRSVSITTSSRHR